MTFTLNIKDTFTETKWPLLAENKIHESVAKVQ